MLSIDFWLMAVALSGTGIARRRWGGPQWI